jgi:hypothetical protein
MARPESVDRNTQQLADLAHRDDHRCAARATP